MRAVEITTENANALRELFRPSIATYSVFENLQKLIKRRSTGIAGPMRVRENSRRFCKGSDRIEVVTHAEHLNDANKIRWC
jgi:hypothetical protein